MDSPHPPHHTIELQVNGASLAPHRATHLGLELCAWQLEAGLSQAAQLRLSFDISAAARLSIGDNVSLTDSGKTIFSGSIGLCSVQRQPGAQSLACFTAFDALYPLQHAQRLEAYEPAPLGETITKLFAKSGLSCSALAPGPHLARLIKWGCNDLDWAAAVCATYGLYFTLRGSKVQFFKLGEGGPATATQTLDAAAGLFSYTLHQQPALARTKTETFATDFGTLAPVAAVATGNGSNSGSSSGSSQQRGAAGKRHMAGGMGVVDKSALKHMAEADIGRGTLASAYASGLTEGNLALHPGTWLTLQDKAANINAAVQLTHVQHCFAPDTGLVTQFATTPPAPPHLPGAPPVALATVSTTADPQARGRIKAKLDAFNGLETDWLHVCHPGAGKNKGLIIAPEIEDQVLVACSATNPAQGVVICGLYGERAQPSAKNADKHPRPFTMHTAGGQYLQLDDHEDAALLESKGGLLSLHPSLVRLLANTDLHIEAPGRNITITANKINFKQG